MELLPNLFKDEHKKMVAVLAAKFGLEHIEIAEDIVSDTFLMAAESWGMKGVPANPTAWLYTVAKNRTIDLIRRKKLFTEKIKPELSHTAERIESFDFDLSADNINDSQLKMLFAICRTDINAEAQIGLALKILCGFGIDEIASAFMVEKESIRKRLYRARQKLKAEKLDIVVAEGGSFRAHLEPVLRIIYLLFNEGYFSTIENKKVRKDLCLEAMRLNLLLLNYENTQTAKSSALMALMCFHASRFEARVNDGPQVLYDEQDRSLWNMELVQKGEKYLNQSAKYQEVSKYQLEAMIAYWHTGTHQEEEKWSFILALYNQLLNLEDSPSIQLNRIFALSKVEGKKKALKEVKKLDLSIGLLYHSLLAYLFEGEDRDWEVYHLKEAIKVSKNESDRLTFEKKLNRQ